MWIRKSLRRKILLGYFILVAVIAAVGVWAIYSVQQLNRVLHDITRDNYVSVLAAENMIGAIERQDSGQLTMLVGELDSGRAVYAAGHQEFALWFGKEEQNITLPGEDELVRRVKGDYDRYEHLFSALNSLLNAGEKEAARKLYLSEIQPLFEQIRDTLQAILTINDAEFMAGNERSGATARAAALSMAVVTGSAVVFGIIFALALSRAVVRPTIRLTEAIRRIREGNFSETVEVGSLDELGTLASEFNDMLRRLHEYENALHGRLATERQKALAIIQTMKDGVLLLDSRQLVVMLNPAAEAILGITAAAAIGRPVNETGAAPAIAGRVGQVIKAGGFVADGTGAVCVADADHYYEIDTVPFALEGTETGLAVIFKDVTYFKVAEQKKAAFLSGVAHELRTPLTSITMGVGMLGESSCLKEAAGDAELLGVIREETDRLRGLVDELMEVSRFESGRGQLKTQPVDIAALLERTLAPFRLRAEKAGVNFAARIGEHLPEAVWDADRIQSVITNLLDNALRYTPGGGTITLTAAARGEGVRLTVADSGPGIPRALQAKIFDSFYQLGIGQGGQAGLGLAICKAIVERHGGRIWVESEEGHGTAFLIDLPLSVNAN